MLPNEHLSSCCANRRSQSKCARSKASSNCAGSEGSNFHADNGNGPMHKRQQFSTFQSYLKDREHRIKRLVSAIEKRGVEGRSIDVVCLWTRSIAICRVSSLNTCSTTSRRWQTFRHQLSVPPPCLMASRLMARMSGWLMRRSKGKPLLN